MTNNPKIIPVNPSVTEPIIGENINHLPNKTTTFDSTKLLHEKIETTLDECIKEWKEKGFEAENNDKSISFRNTKLNIDIYVNKLCKEIQICVCHYNYAQTISFELHNLIHKTLKALEVENG